MVNRVTDILYKILFFHRHIDITVFDKLSKFIDARLSEPRKIKIHLGKYLS